MKNSLLRANKLKKENNNNTFNFPFWMQGEEIGMLDNRAISYADTLDPAACNLGQLGNWMEESRDPERKSFYISLSTSFFFQHNFLSGKTC